MLNATGWDHGHLPADVVARGNIVFTDAEGRTASKPLVLQLRGTSQVSIEIDEGGKKHHAVANGGLGGSDSGPSFAPLHSVRSLALPFMTDLSLTDDTDVKVESLPGDSVSSLKFKVWRTPPSSVQTKTTPLEAEALKEFSTLTVWLSPETNLPLQIEYKKGTGNPFHGSPQIRKFSDYRRVGGLMVAFHQEEWIDKSMLYATDLTDVSFNQNLTDSDFSAEKVRRQK